MSVRDQLLNQLESKFQEALNVESKMLPDYASLSPMSSSQVVYEMNMKELNRLGNEINNLKELIMNLPKENDAIHVDRKNKLTFSLQNEMNFRISIQNNIDQAQSDFQRNVLDNQKVLSNTRIQHLEVLLSLL